MSDFYNDLLIELECPVCTNYMAPPIRQCETGHSLCQSCRTKLPKCPLCQGAFTESKNLTLEALACKMRYPCVNKSSGCEEHLTLQEKEPHEKNCSYKGFRCAMERCSWSGKLEDILDHWNSKKTKSKIYTSFNICHTKIKSDSYYANLVQAHEQLFWFKCKLEKGKIFWAVQFLGHKDKARNYYYEIEVFKPGYSRRKILFCEYCQSIELENSDLFKEGVCTAASVDCLKRFVGEDELLIYYLRVHLDESDRSEEVKSPRRSTKKNFDKSWDKPDKHRDRSRGSATHKFRKNHSMN